MFDNLKNMAGDLLGGDKLKMAEDLLAKAGIEVDDFKITMEGSSPVVSGKVKDEATRKQIMSTLGQVPGFDNFKNMIKIEA